MTLIMARDTTLGVTSDTSDRVHAYKADVQARSVDEAINHALDIAEGESEDHRVVDAVELEERVTELEEQRERLAAGFMDIRDRVNEYHGEPQE